MVAHGVKVKKFHETIKKIKTGNWYKIHERRKSDTLRPSERVTQQSISEYHKHLWDVKYFRFSEIAFFNFVGRILTWTPADSMTFQFIIATEYFTPQKKLNHSICEAESFALLLEVYLKFKIYLKVRSNYNSRLRSNLPLTWHR